MNELLKILQEAKAVLGKCQHDLQIAAAAERAAAYAVAQAYSAIARATDGKAA